MGKHTIAGVDSSEVCPFGAGGVIYVRWISVVREISLLQHRFFRTEESLQI